MIGTDLRRPDAPTGSSAPEPVQGVGLLFVVLAILTAVGLGALVVVSARASDPVLLGILSVLGMIGSFFLFGLAAGHIRIGAEPTVEGGVAAQAADLIAPGVMITARDGSVVYANQAYRALAGVDQDGEPRSLEVAFAGEPQAAECLFRLMRAAELGEERTEEFRVRGLESRDRAGRWLRLTVRPLKSGAIAKIGRAASLWQLTDISSERAREAEAVRTLEAEVGRYEAMPIGLIGASLDGRIAHLNATLESWLGLDAGAAPNRELALSDIIAGDGDALLRAALAGAGGEVVRLDLDLVREDGRGLSVEVIARLGSPGERSGDIFALVLTRPLRSGRAVSAPGAEARFERLFHSAPFGIATLGEDGTIESFNAAFARMFYDAGLGPAGNVKSMVAAAADPDAAKAIDVALAEAKAGRAALAPIEISFGSDRQFTRRLYISPTREGLAPGEAALLYAIDATEQKALELKYAQSTKMEAVGKLAGGIAHDFNNVLTAILGFSDLLLQTHRPFDPAHKDIMNIKKEANRAARLVRQLLAFSRRQTLTPEVLELGEVLTDLSVLLNRLIGEKIDLKLVSGRDLWLVKADRTQFDQVVMNLAVNAKDAMPDGGRLTIRTKNITERESLKLRAQAIQPGEYVLIEVEDTGTGMTPEVMAKIFEPFFSTKEVGKGTGLGLSTVYGIIKQTGGYIFPDSTPGKGTVFRVYLPRHVPEPQVEAEPAATEQTQPRNERSRDLTGTGRVLLVEDEDSVRNFAVRALKRQGYEVIEATTGVEALELVATETRPIDIVVSDVVMPEMDGPTMLTEMRKTRPDLKVIFVSGYPDDRFKTSLDPDAHYAFLAKPFSLPQLAAKVKEELAR
jgi:two-component system cell cycle sensor histidine kinase/response regulator CckA